MHQNHIKTTVRRIGNAEIKIKIRMTGLADHRRVNFPGILTEILGAEKIE